MCNVFAELDGFLLSRKTRYLSRGTGFSEEPGGTFGSAKIVVEVLVDPSDFRMALGNAQSTVPSGTEMVSRAALGSSTSAHRGLNHCCSMAVVHNLISDDVRPWAMR